MPYYFGAGFSPAGTSNAGYGSVDQAAIPAKDLLNDPYGPRFLDSRRIDPVTRDYVLGPAGTLLGMTRGQQYVELVYLTDQGTCCIKSLGHRLRHIKVISDSFENEVKQTIRAALNAGVSSGLIEIVSIDLQRIGKNGAFIKTRFRDMSAGIEFERVI